MLLVASETGHVYAYATHKLKPMIGTEQGRAYIQNFLNSPDSKIFYVDIPKMLASIPNNFLSQ